MATKKTASKKATAKPKTMASRRNPVAKRPTGVSTTPQVTQAIVRGIIASRKKNFTSTEIAEITDASPRHSRRTLAALADQRILTVNRAVAPFVYSVAEKARLRSLVG